MSDSPVTGILRYFGIAGTELLVGSIPITTLAETYGTPLFVYDAAVMDRKLNMLRAALPERFQICYSVKANPNVAIVRHFVERGCGLEIASNGELAVARAAECPMERIVFAGPGKTDAELEAAVGAGIGEIHVESINEAKRLAGICRRLQARARTALRINPTGDSQGGAMRMGGKPAPFGIDEEKIDAVLAALANEPVLELRGIHMYAGTQILDHTVLAGQYRKCLEIARRVASATGGRVETVDFGGGLGVPYFDGDKELDMAGFAQELAVLAQEISRDPVFQHTRFLVEPGRYLVSESGVYVMRVVDVKESRGKTYVICDGGMHHHLAASGNLGQTIKRNFPVAAPAKLGQPAQTKVDLVGPLCTPLDTVGRGVMLPDVERGDLVGIFQSGAYARTASPLGFLSHPTPPEVLVDGAEHYLIRARGQADAMKDIVLPARMETRP